MEAPERVKQLHRWKLDLKKTLALDGEIKGLPVVLKSPWV